MVSKISLNGRTVIKAGDTFTIGDDPTLYHCEKVDKHGDITAFSIVSLPQPAALEPPQLEYEDF